MTIKQLSVRLLGEPVGELKQTPTGKMTFQYFPTAKQAVSLSLPLRERPYDHAACDAYFGGLLPESKTARQAIAKRFGISANNVFSLLRVIGYDCAGAISLHHPDDEVHLQRHFPFSGRKISDDELYLHIQSLPTKPLFMDVDDLRLSLAGVQDKAAVCLLANDILIPSAGCPTTHILKPDNPQFPNIIDNEFFCLTLAKKCGLRVPTVMIRHVNDRRFLLIERYDRIIEGDSIARVHQEDFCQALGISSDIKYQNEGGPGFKECFELLNRTTQPAVNRQRLMQLLILNFLIGNMDAHGKNFSLLHQSQGIIELAPCYDIVNTLIYDGLSTKMAMKIGSKYHYNAVQERHWQQLCDAINYAFPPFKTLFQQLKSTLLEQTLIAKDVVIEAGMSPEYYTKIVRFLTEHA